MKKELKIAHKNQEITWSDLHKRDAELAPSNADWTMSPLFPFYLKIVS
jgi:hypothetical protein